MMKRKQTPLLSGNNCVSLLIFYLVKGLTEDILGGKFCALNASLLCICGYSYISLVVILIEFYSITSYFCKLSNC